MNITGETFANIVILASFAIAAFVFWRASEPVVNTAKSGSCQYCEGDGIGCSIFHIGPKT